MTRTIVLTICCIAMAFFANAIPMPELEGTWYVNKSNFRMWLKRNNHNPTFTYTSATRRGKEGLKDEVVYTKGNKTRHVIGFDKPLNPECTKFVWRGKGLLAIAKSKWEILYSSEEFVIIHFQKTLFTRAGYDVISRQKTLKDATMRAVDARLKELGVTEALRKIEQQ